MGTTQPQPATADAAVDATVVDAAAGVAVTEPALVLKDMPVAVRPCMMAAALEIIGERWSLLAVREMSYGVHRFAQIAGYTGASRDILADRLRKLEAAGIVERRRYSDHPPRYEYHLTQAGRELFPVMAGLLAWSQRWLADGPASAPVFRHTCGAPLDIEPRCRHCGEPVTGDSQVPAATGATT
jgi:DNA-binding HxlR family transcriptional regulator